MVCRVEEIAGIVSAGVPKAPPVFHLIQATDVNQAFKIIKRVTSPQDCVLSGQNDGESCDTP